MKMKIVTILESRPHGDITEQMIEKMVNSYKDTIIFNSKEIYLYNSSIVRNNYKRIAKI